MVVSGIVDKSNQIGRTVQPLMQSDMCSAEARNAAYDTTKGITIVAYID